jgi:hypothetical protein
MVVNIIITEPATSGKFADVKLSFISKQGNNRDVRLNVGFQNLNDFSNDTKSVRFDFFLISSIVYGIDNLLDRHEYSIDAWARDIEICFPVNNLQIWNAVKTQVEELLTFLTGDYWSVSFSQTNIRSFFKEKAKRWKSKIPTYDFANYSFASLFSGGLDSLVGVINGLDSLLANKKGLLISHYDGTSPGANKDQERLNDFLSVQPGYRNKYDWIQEGVSLSNSDTTNTNLVKESSYCIFCTKVSH